VDCPVDVGGVHPGEGVAQVHGYAVGQAGGEPKYPPLASAAEEAAVVEGGYRGRPVDRGHQRDAAGPDVDVAVAEVVAVQP
jgi:hypothetical protein